METLEECVKKRESLTKKVKDLRKRLATYDTKTSPKTSPKKRTLEELRNPLEKLGEDLERYIMTMLKITFFDEPVAYDVFFKENDLFKYNYSRGDPFIYIITVTGKNGGNARLFITKEVIDTETYNHIYIMGYEPIYLNIDYYDDVNDNDKTLEYKTPISYKDDIIVSFKVEIYSLGKVVIENPRKLYIPSDYVKTPIIEFDRETMETEKNQRLIIKKTSSGGRKASVKKEVCGKLRCIYTIAGSRKEHIKYKGQLIAVADYKKLMKKA